VAERTRSDRNRFLLFGGSDFLLSGGEVELVSRQSVVPGAGAAHEPGNAHDSLLSVPDTGPSLTLREVEVPYPLLFPGTTTRQDTTR
jgi:hypothetical protein